MIETFVYTDNQDTIFDVPLIAASNTVIETAVDINFVYTSNQVDNVYNGFTSVTRYTPNRYLVTNEQGYPTVTNTPPAFKSEIVALEGGLAAEIAARIAADLLKTDKTYVDAQDTVINNLITVLKGGSSETIASLKSSVDAINAIIGSATPDADAFVNTVKELLAIFSTFPEGVDILAIISSKVNIADIVNNLSQVISGKVLDATQGKVLKDLIDGNTASIASNLALINTNTSNIAANTSAIALKANASDISSTVILTRANLDATFKIYSNPALTGAVNVNYLAWFYNFGRPANSAEVTNLAGGGFTLTDPLDVNDKIVLIGSMGSQPANSIVATYNDMIAKATGGRELTIYVLEDTVNMGGGKGAYKYVPGFGIGQIAINF